MPARNMTCIHTSKCSYRDDTAADWQGRIVSAFAGGTWRLGVTVDKVLEYSLTAADILRTPAQNSIDIIDGMNGHLEALCFDVDAPLELVRRRFGGAGCEHADDAWSAT